jgi:hypothetical protein
MKPLPFIWKRLVVNGQTCDRCNETLHALQDALAKLNVSLAPLGILPALEMQVIERDEFAAEPSASNRVWILGRPLEDWLGASAGSSACCSVCGDAQCRTLEMDGRTYETIPAELFIRAGLAAAAQLMQPADAPAQSSAACCAAPCCPG